MNGCSCTNTYIQLGSCSNVDGESEAIEHGAGYSDLLASLTAEKNLVVKAEAVISFPTKYVWDLHRPSPFGGRRSIGFQASASPIDVAKHTVISSITSIVVPVSKKTRACQNVSWRELYPFSRVVTLPPSRSDHCPLLIEVNPEPGPLSKAPRRFRFEEMWLQHTDCINVIEQGWMLPVTGDFMGQWTSQPNEVADILVNYYENIFRSEQVDNDALGLILDSLLPKVTEAMNNDLLAPYTDSEIKKALFQMHPSKSPGPDGMSPCFFQKFWDVVGHDVCMAVRNVLLTGQVSRESNFTHLALIPKVKEPKLPSDLRPIALCNVVYKIASKVLANRLKSILPQIVSPLQSAFVPGRLISDNTLVATEVAHFMKKLRCQSDGFFSLKLDISKAYDRLEWQYVEAVLLKLGFCRRWVNIVMATIKSASYSILMNGTPTGFILPTRGIRQGDPLSPYLFILCAEGFSLLISASIQHGTIRGLLMSPTAPIIHHLLFADDCFLFGEASVRECQAFKDLLSIYARASGQRINLQKSSVVFSGSVDLQTRNHLSSILGVTCVKEHGLYLGLPIHVGHNKTTIFSYLKERLTKKLISWRSKILSAGGKELLIKVVAQTLPNYVMNCYLLPKSLCDDLQQLCSQFFWGSTNEKKRIHWRSWERMCVPKEAGGMGFKHLHAHNLAMLAKQGWRILSNPDSLVARVFKAVYHPWGSFLTADMGDRPSYSWRSIMEARSVLQAGLFWRIGNGMFVRIWEDDWIPNVPSHSIAKPVDTVFELVSDLINEQEGTWDIPTVNACFAPEVAFRVFSIPLSRRVGGDRTAWKLDKHGFFSVKSAYTIAQDISIGNVFASTSTGDPFAPLWKALWKANVPSKVAIFGWRAAHNLLPTRAALTSKGYSGELNCCVCSQYVETLEHLFRDCSIAKDILGAPPFSFLPSSLSWKEWFLDNALTLSTSSFDKLLILLWSLWTNRNEKLWRNRSRTSQGLVASSMAWYEEYLQANTPINTPTSGSKKVSKRWQAPTGETLKLNVDGAFLPNVPFGGTCGVLRNAQGRFLAAFSRWMNFVSSPLHAELLALKTGIELLQAIDVTNVVIESDCLMAVQAVNSLSCDLSSLRALVADIKGLLDGYADMCIIFAPRQANVIAHRLASLSFESDVHLEWFVNAPELILDALM
ncbi:uncharacterized protein LOC112164272 [Rosa chinensis]|uniref:uncharacterized protein LOC112164272 n=1 Tax=Rosa chinensis TaxID=74649 RepID=UPI000D08DDCE|nr:uncharacterized protein LOC112164272 [Rosa chinensis]